MAEWSIAAVLKTAVPVRVHRGFESLPIRSSPGLFTVPGALARTVHTKRRAQTRPSGLTVLACIHWYEDVNNPGYWYKRTCDRGKS